ncbi:MAG: PilZ domain-containing protein [Sphingomonas sp.]|nr:PilZ domain-containing protein [Sphingomonas sp.]
MDESSDIQNRRSSRSNVLLKATLEMPGGPLTVVLRNLSQEGALVQGDDLPEAGERVLFHRQGLSVPSRIAWSHCGHAGLEFEFPLFPGELLRHIPTAGRKPPPPINKRPGLAPRPLSLSEQQMIERWASDGTNRLGT